MQAIKTHLEYLPLVDSEAREQQHWQHQHSAPVAKVLDKLKQERNVVKELVAPG